MSVTYEGRELNSSELMDYIGMVFCELHKIGKGNEWKLRDPDYAKIVELMESAGIFTLTHTSIGFEAYTLLPYGKEVWCALTEPVCKAVVTQLKRSNNLTLEGMCKLGIEIARQDPMHDWDLDI